MTFTATKTHTHSFSSVWEHNDLSHWHQCTCGEHGDEAFHTYTWTVLKAPTATEDGEQKGVCSVCGYQQTGSGSGGDAGGSGQPSQPSQPGQPGQPSQPSQPGQGGDSGNTGNTGNTGNSGNAGSNSPKTGDMGVALWSTLAGLCGCGLIAVAVKSRYKGKRVA